MFLKQLMGVLASALLAVTGVAAAEHKHDHDHGHGGAKPQLTLDHGKKWPTDASLRQGMEQIREQVNTALPAIHTGKMSNAQYDALAQKVEAEVAGIVAACKLPAEADAQLHIVVADLLEGAEAMAGKQKKVKRMNGAVKIIGTLDRYAAHFDHPGWKPIKH
jgi:DNA-directed RNA polymerase subunit L